MLDDLTSSKARIRGNPNRGSKNSRLNSSTDEPNFGNTMGSKDHPFQNTLNRQKNPSLKGSLNKPAKQPFGIQPSDYENMMSEDERTDLGSLMKDIDKRLHRNKNGKGSPPKLQPDKYYTDNEAALKP